MMDVRFYLDGEEEEKLLSWPQCSYAVLRTLFLS